MKNQIVIATALSKLGIGSVIKPQGDIAVGAAIIRQSDSALIDAVRELQKLCVYIEKNGTRPGYIFNAGKVKLGQFNKRLADLSVKLGKPKSESVEILAEKFVNITDSLFEKLKENGMTAKDMKQYKDLRNSAVKESLNHDRKVSKQSSTDIYPKAVRSTLTKLGYESTKSSNPVRFTLGTGKYSIDYELYPVPKTNTVYLQTQHGAHNYYMTDDVLNLKSLGCTTYNRDKYGVVPAFDPKILPEVVKAIKGLGKKQMEAKRECKQRAEDLAKNLINAMQVKGISLTPLGYDDTLYDLRLRGFENNWDKTIIQDMQIEFNLRARYKEKLVYNGVIAVNNKDTMLDAITKLLKKEGYPISGIEFKQFTDGEISLKFNATIP